MPKRKVQASETKKKTSTKTTSRGRKKAEVPAQKEQIRKLSNLRFGTFLSSITSNFQNNRKLYARYLIITGLVILLGAFLFWKKDWFVAATVNNQPITTLELYQNMKAKYGEEVLEQILRDRLISQEATKRGIQVSSNQINEKISEIEKQVGGKEQLEQALATRNISQNDFRNQIKTQILVEKILEKEITVSEKEIDDYVTQNRGQVGVVGIDEQGNVNREEIKNQLRTNKLNDKFQTWYEEVQKQAKINKFI